MKTLVYRHWLPPTLTELGSALKETRHRMDAATALAAHPGAVEVPEAMEPRNVPGSDANMQASITGD